MVARLIKVAVSAAKTAVMPVNQQHVRDAIRNGGKWVFFMPKTVLL